MGTPEISMLCLKKLIEDGHGISAVISREDKPRGRGNVMTPTPTKALALEAGIPVYTPKTLRDESFTELLREISPELIVVVAYGKILPKEVIDFPKYGCINLHVSLLPKYRGAAPMQRAIMEGEGETGVTVMYMDEGLDTGDVILVKKVTIDKNDNFESVHDKLAQAGSEALLEAVSQIEGGTATYTAQPSHYTYAEKITKADCLIDFGMEVNEVHDKIRGLSPIPLAYTKTPDGKILKIVKSRVIGMGFNGQCGEILSLDGTIFVKCKNGVVALDIVVPEGKGRMNATDYINGRKVKVGDILG